MRKLFFSLLLAFIGNGIASAGSVTALVSGGQLFIYGDAADNSIVIDSPQPGHVQVSGLPGFSGGVTTINGQANGTVAFVGWTGGIYCYMYGGSDGVTLTRGVVRGPTHFDLGEGDDVLEIGSVPSELHDGYVEMQANLLVIASNGDDFVSLTNTRVKGSTTIDLGNGADDLQIGDRLMLGTIVAFDSTCFVFPGSGLDVASIDATYFQRDFILDDSTSSLNLSLQAVAIEQNAFLYGTPSNDTFELDDLNVGGLLQVFTEGGDDALTLLATECKTLEVFAGAGIDSVQFDTVFAITMRVFLDAGADSFSVNNGSFQRMYCYGASENDRFSISSTTATELNVFGDGGTDTLIRSANTIGTTRLYSVENK